MKMLDRIKTKITNKFRGYYLCPGINEVRTVRSSMKYADSYRQALKASSGIPGFTLIELLIVIAIIGILSSVVLVSLSNARSRAKATAALASGSQLLRIVEMCDLDGGKIKNVSNITTGGGDICDKGASYGTWPKAPDGFYYYAGVWTGTDQNMFLIRETGASPVDNGDIYCGHNSNWATHSSNAIRRLGTGFSCAQLVNRVWR